MYLRKNEVQGRRGRRAYVSIAHNVWWTDERTRYAQSRPVVIANLGTEEQVDVDFARELVVAVERSTPMQIERRGEGRAVATRVAEEVRRIEPFLRALVSRRLGFAALFPPGPPRIDLLESLIRDKLSDPAAEGRDDVEGVILTVLRAASPGD